VTSGVCARDATGQAAKQRNELAPPYARHGVSSRLGAPVCLTLNLPQSGRLVLGADLNCSEACPSMCRTRVAHGDRVDGGVAQTTRDYVRPSRSIFSNAPNLRCSAIAALVLRRGGIVHSACQEGRRYRLRRRVIGSAPFSSLVTGRVSRSLFAPRTAGLSEIARAAGSAFSRS
jgi:hypothetical protein